MIFLFSAPTNKVRYGVVYDFLITNNYFYYSNFELLPINLSTLYEAE